MVENSNYKCGNNNDAGGIPFKICKNTKIFLKTHM